MKKVFFGMMLFVIVFSVSLFARTIELKTGEKIEGEIIQRDEKGLLVKIPYGEVRVSWADLSEAELKRLAARGEEIEKDFPAQEVIEEPVELYGKQYLYGILKDTWAQIYSLIDKKSGLPFDNSSKQDYTSASNTGLYLASLYAAQRFGFITRPDALRLAEKAISSLEKLRKWHGFPVSWFHLSTLKMTNGVISPIDTGNLVGGLIVLRRAYPEIAARCSKLIDDMQWEDFYDQKKKTLKGGYTIAKTNYLDFTYNELGSDTRMASFIGVASGKMPVEHWENLNRILEERYDVQYLGPGWRAGGIFLHGLSALFLDERGTLLGHSMANAAYAQILHARKEGYPVWGWSCSSSPGGNYIGTGQIVDRVVTPHASAMAVWYYPQQVVANLKKLEEMGVRSSKENDGNAYGFYDAVDIEKKRVQRKFLFIDQGMIFLSLANYLGNGVIWNIVKKDPLVASGMKKIKEYQEKNTEEIARICAERDRSEELVSEALTLPIENSLVRPYVVKKQMHAEIPYGSDFQIDADLSDWKDISILDMPAQHCLEVGVITSENDFGVTYRFAWDETNLYIAAKIIDDDIVLKHEKITKIWKDDSIELFIDPKNDKMIWGHQRDFQIGFSPPVSGDAVRSWAWFQGKAPEGKTAFSLFEEEGKTGYIIEASIPWKYLGVTPAEGLVLGFSPAAHDLDDDAYGETKYNWSFVSGNMIKLGEVTLSKK